LMIGASERLTRRRGRRAQMSATTNRRMRLHSAPSLVGPIIQPRSPLFSFTPRSNMRIAVTADLHFGHNRLGDDATRLMLEHLRREPPDLLLLGGDIGTDEHFAACLQLFAELPCRKALVPGNHDLWVADDDERGDSLAVYQEYLPGLCKEHGYH